MFENKRIKGVNLGGWLLMEGYILGGRNIPESEFKEKFKKIYSQAALREFERLFRDNFIQGEDFRNIAAMGANTVRLPFNYRLIETKPFIYSEEGLGYLEKALSLAQRCKLGVILDLHAACGAQNRDWHSDSHGRAMLWEKENYRQRTYALWEKIASRLKDSPALIGYDILNEPVLEEAPIARLKSFYQKAIKRIRAVDQRHLIFLEGNNWAQDIGFLKGLIDENIAISVHTYAPLDYVFNFTPFQKFPGLIDGAVWGNKRIRRYLEPYARFSDKNKVRIYVGEFGINWRGGGWGELAWLEGMLKVFEEFDFDYTYWTYKAVSQGNFPDGIFQYLSNSDYLKRQGPIFGWENYPILWKKERYKIADFWQTKNCSPNIKIISKLKQFFNM